MPYTPVEQRQIGMKRQVNFKSIDTTERLTIPSLGGTALSTQATILPKKGAEMMKFPEIYPGAVSEAVQRLGPAPGIGVKVPFMQKEIRLTEEVPLIKQQAKWLVELPEKVITSLKEIPYTIAEKTTPEYKGKIYRVPSYQEDSLNMTKSLMDLGYSPAEAVTAAVLQTGGQAIIDVTILSSLLESGARAVAKNANPALEERIAAWKTMGRPATAEELSAEKIRLSRMFNPELSEARTAGTANAEALRSVNNADAILRKGGIPTQADLIKMRIGQLATPLAEQGTLVFTRTAKGKIQLTPITDILKPSPALKAIGKGVMPLELPGLPQLPGYVPITERPAFGLRGLEIEKVKPVGKAIEKAIPKELQPLLQELSKEKAKIISINQAMQKFEQTGTANIIVGDKYGVVIKDEGEGFVQVIFGPTKLTEIGKGVKGTRSFSTKEEAFAFAKQLQEKIVPKQLVSGIPKELEPFNIELKPFTGRKDTTRGGIFTLTRKDISQVGKTIKGVDGEDYIIKEWAGHGNISSEVREGKRVAVSDMFEIAPDLQRKGIGSQLWKSFIEPKAKEIRAEEIWVTHVMPDAREFWGKMGFKPAGKDETSRTWIKSIKEVKPEVTKPAKTPKAEEAQLSLLYQKEFNKIQTAGEKKLMDDIKSAGGLKTDPTLKEEMSDLPIDIMKTTGMMPDEMVETLSLKGYNFESSSDLLEAIKDIRSMPTRFRTPERELATIRAIKTKMPTPSALTPEQLDRMERRLIREATKKGITIPPRRMIERVTGIRPERRMITKPEDILLRARVKAEARGARIGFRVARTLTRKELITKFKSSQTTIRELKDEVINRIKGNLPMEARGKFLQALERDLTRKSVYGLYERIERISEQIKRREIVEELKEVPKGNIAVDYQKKIEETMRGIDLVKPTESTLRKLQGLSEYIKREGIPLGINIDTLNKLDRLSKKNVSQMTVGELTELQDTVRTLQQLGKLKFQLKFKYNQRERQIALQKLLGSTINLDPPVTPIMGRLGQWDMAKVQTRRTYMETVHIPRVADIIDGYKGYEGENAKYIKRLGAKETLAKVDTQETIIGALEEIQKLGVKELTPDQQLRMMINIRVREGAYDQAKTLMEKNKLTKVPELTETENKIIEIVRKAINKSTDEIAAISEEIENKPFRRIPEYTLPIKYEYEFNMIPSQTIEQGRHRVTQTFKGFVYERQKGVERMPRTDIMGIFEEAVNEQQWYIKIQPELENLRYLVKSKEYIEKGGQMVANFWKDYMDVVARRGWSAMATSNPLLRAARINMGRSILGYKLTSILMQPFSVFDAIAYGSTRFGGTATLQILKEFSKSWVNPKYARQIIAESPALQMRKGGEVAVEELAPGLVARPPRGIERRMPTVIRTALRKFQKEALTWLQDFDIRTAAGVQKAIENILVKSGIPNAKQESEFFMNITQGSAEITYRPMILSRGEGSRTLFTFQTFFLNRWGVIAHDLITSGLIKNKGWGKKFAALVGLAIMMAASVAEQEARYAILELTKKTKKKASMWVSALMALPENIPIFGNMISSAVTYGTTDFDFPLARVVENAIGGIGVVTKKTTEAKIMAGLRATESFAELLGIAGSAQFFDFLEGIFGGKEEGPKMMPMPTKKEGGGRPPLIMPKKLNIGQPQLENIITNLIKRELA